MSDEIRPPTDNPRLEELGNARRLTVDLGHLDSVAAYALPDDAPLLPLFRAVRDLLEEHGIEPREAVLVTSPAGVRLELALDADPMGEKALVTGDEADELIAGTRALLAERAAALEAEHGADTPLISGTGERLLDEAGYAGMRRAVLEVSRALGAIEEGLFDALIATAERSVGPGLEQAVAAGEVPLDRLGPAREALELELRLFRCARTFRTGVGSVQDAVRRHQQAEEERAGAPPAIEVIRHNAPKNGGGT